ncbi:hypothetical protein AM588_10010017 [Phytophthora nicotianae]|uniref:Uncharacterized protein n=1 Tax=Phytophthora nicotianae TaxID=4792 RepID=A0A0W8DG53_PHYNI|nr:hypothetical protein AM588_10010017 [Phytophthora nicotianae]
MKRVFHRRGRSPSASSPSGSPRHASPSTGSPRRAASASAKTFDSKNGCELAEKRAKVAVGSLHAKVVTFATSALPGSQQEALHYLYNVLVGGVQASESVENGRKLLNERDTNTLISVSAQRLRGYFSRALELFNAGRLDGKVHTKFLLYTEKEERDRILQLLRVLKALLVIGDNTQALLLVGERIPSTFVKVVKALSDGGSAEDAQEGLVRIILDVLALLVTSPEVVQELNESSTLHRIFHLAFAEETLQIAVLKKTNLIARAIEHLDDYSEMAQQTIMSVLSAIAIEAKMIPYVELECINAFIRKDTFQRSSIHALLAFIANLIRFDEVYHQVLRSVGLVSTIVALFLDQTNAVCSDAGATQIRVEYPTSTVRAGQPNGVSDPVSADEQLIISLMASHCHQRARRRSSCRTATSRSDYLVLIDIMKMFVDGSRSNTAAMDEKHFEHTLCGLPMLESVCMLIGNATFQLEGLALWASILQLSLVLQEDSVVLRNVINSLLQAIRYVTLAAYFPQDGDVALVFPGSLEVLQGALEYIESLLRPKSASTTAMTKLGDHDGACIEETSMKERIIGALLDCDIIVSLLGVLCAVTKKWELNGTPTSSNDAAVSYSVVMMSLQSIYSIVATNAEAEQQMCRYESNWVYSRTFLCFIVANL